MDDKDGRRSRVPAGTFGDSSRPPRAEAAPDPDPEAEAERERESAPAAGGAERKRFVSTLTGKGALGDTDPPPAARILSQRTGNTLVGHPSVSSPQSGSPSAVLSPPKWRGAKPYLEGEEPQPRISSIPTPPPPPPQAKPAGVAIGVLRSKVTTKVGQPIAQPPTTAQQPAIDDTIQRMLETQASVPMQVEESADDSIPEIPFDQLPIEQLEDSLPRVPKGTLAAVRAADAPTSEPTPAPAPRGGAMSMPEARPEPVAPVARERDRDMEPGFMEPGFASSVAPAEVVRRPRKDDSQSAVGLLAVAVFAVLFVGGWFLTRGGYQPRHRVMTVAPPAAATNTPPSAPSDLAPAAAAPTQPGAPDAPAAAATQAKPQPTPAAPQRDAAEAARAPRRPRTTAKPGLAAPASAAEADDDGDGDSSASPPAPEQRVLTVKPSADPANLPEIPGREDVISALEPLRPAISECSRGTHGVAQLDITVSSSGAVSHAVVGGDFAGTAEGSCIARAARDAQFSPFKKPRFRVIYPFSL